MVRVAFTTDGDVTFRGFTLRNHGQVGTSPTAPSFAILLKSDDPGVTYEFANLEVEGLGAGGRDYGIDADSGVADLIFRNSSIANTDFNPILIESLRGATTIRDNFISPNGTTNANSIFVFTHTNAGNVNDVLAPQRILRNVIDANGRGGITVQTGFPGLGPSKYNAVSIRENVITELGTTAVGINNTDTTAPGTGGDISNVEIEDNFARPADPAGTTSRGVALIGRVRNVSVRGNDFAGLARGMTVASNAGGQPLDVTVHFNRFAGNATSGFDHAGTQPVSARNNWWGCNEGPGQPGCSTVTGSGAGAVDFDPWLVLGVSADPTTVPAGGSSQVTADLTQNSNGDTAGTQFPGGVPVAFTATLGTIQSPVLAYGGQAKSVFSAGTTAGTADLTADLDGESVSTQVTVQEAPNPPDPTGPSEPPDPPAGPGSPKTGRCANEQLGSRGADTIVGTSFGDRMLGFRGADTLRGRADRDCLLGGPQADRLFGGGGTDLLLGQAGADRAYGGDGADTLFGAEGRDRLTGNAGRDRLFGGDANDIIKARGGERDYINCGDGRDTVLGDANDRVRPDCEVVR